MERFDAAVIGAGPEGLVAASLLARAGLRTVVLEKSAEAGGRATTFPFHPGFWASPFADELPRIPSRLFRALDLARHGGILFPSAGSVCLSDDGESVLFADGARALWQIPHLDRDAVRELRRDISQFELALDARSAEAEPRLGRMSQGFTGGEVPEPWPGEGWMQQSLADALGMRFTASSLRLHLAANAAAGRAVSPVFPGTALHLLAPGTGRSGLAIGGLGGLGSALAASARNAGAELRFDSAVQEIAISGGRGAAIVLASGAELRARAIVSTLDLRHTFMGLLRWKRLDASEMRRVAQFRMAGQRARVLFALDAPPEMPFVRDTPELASAPIHVVSSMDAIARSYESWAYGAIPDSPPVTLRVPSFVDPRLAPVGKAVMTATLSAIPAHLIEGAWDDEKRKRLAAIALVAADRASPGLAKHVVDMTVLTAADIEARLGLSEGDFEGGVLTPDQVLGARPFPEWIAGRTPVRSLYLAGPSAAPAPFLLGAAGERAARSVLADLTRARNP